MAQPELTAIEKKAINILSFQKSKPIGRITTWWKQIATQEEKDKAIEYARKEQDREDKETMKWYKRINRS